MWRRSRVTAIAFSIIAACGKQAPPPEQTTNAPPLPAEQEPPVPLNPDSPIQYPPRLFDRRVEGDVVLRLFVDSTGRVVPESSRVGESSGYPALDSAALAGAKKLRYAPARHRGAPVAAAFLQRIEFRHPQGNVVQGSPDAPAQ
jgi:protein TonB